MKKNETIPVSFPALQVDQSKLHQYLDEAVNFLAQYSWIYNVKNTDIFVSDVLQKIPVKWIDPLLNLSLEELKKVPYNFYKEEWPSSLQNFVKKANKLATFRHLQDTASDSTACKIQLPNFIKKNTPLKKLQEIKHMAALIGDITETCKCETVLDIGSGLGYLDQVLHHNFKLITVGLENVEKRTLAAKLRVNRGVCKHNMYHFTQEVEDTDLCLKSITQILKEVNEKKVNCDCGEAFKTTERNSKAEEAIMVGLHSCGNLAQDMMKLFIKLPGVKSYVCAGCCYHQIDLANFPMSNAAKNSITTTQVVYPNWSPCTPGLRLGCQKTRAYWANQTEDDFICHEKCVSYRAVLQCLLHKENLTWHKPKRRLRKETDVTSFETFVTEMLQNVAWSETEKEERLKTLLKLFIEKQCLFPYIKILALLQTLLQPIWEGVITWDRISFFNEHSIHAEIFVMCDELTSPRNLALCGIKQ